MNKKLLGIQTLIIAAGVVYSWSRVVIQLQTFYARYGTIFKFKDCEMPNPLATACFYGAVAFVAAFIWSLNLYLSKEPAQKSEKHLRNFLLFGVCFAATVLAYEFLLYYKVLIFLQLVVPTVTCSPGVFPLKTPCFVGFNVFLIGFIFASYVVKKSKHLTANPTSHTNNNSL